MASINSRSDYGTGVNPWEAKNKKPLVLTKPAGPSRLTTAAGPMDIPGGGGVGLISTGTTSTPPPTATTRPLASDLAESFKTSIGAAPTVGYTPMASQVAKPTAIAGLPDQYFQSQKDQLKSQLRDEFFGQNGQWDQGVSSESAAGRLGSGVGRQMLQKTVTEPFIKADQNIDSGIMQAVMSERARVEGYNADQDFKYQQLLQHANEVDSGNQLQASTASANLASEYNKLAATLADAESGRLSQEGIAKLDSDTRIWQSMLEDRAKAQALAVEREKNSWTNDRQNQANMIDYIGTALNDPSAGQTSTASTLGKDFGGPVDTYAKEQAALDAKTNSETYTNATQPKDFPRNASNGTVYKNSDGLRYMFVKTDPNNPRSTQGTWQRL